MSLKYVCLLFSVFSVGSVVQKKFLVDSYSLLFNTRGALSVIRYQLSVVRCSVRPLRALRVNAFALRREAP